MTINRDYPVVRNMPVAEFYYPGTHSGPVRRKVLITERTSKIIRGYELREGSTVRAFRDAPVKSYSKSKISRICDLDKRRVLYKTTPQNQREQSTLVQRPLIDLVKEGV